MGRDDMDESKISLKKKIEAVLFVSSGSVPMDNLAKFADISVSELSSLITEMNMEYDQAHGLRIIEHKKRVQLTTSPDMAVSLEEFLGIEITTTLSRAALEALAIIAYKQPITRPQIEEVRGVNSDGVVRNLLSKGLIQELGRAETLGKPVLYGTTEDFLHYFGLQSLDDLPDVEKEVSHGGKLEQNILKQ